SMSSPVCDGTWPPILSEEALLHDRKDPRLLAYLNRENAHTERCLAHTCDLRRQVYKEILDRIDLNRGTVPVVHGPYEYYSRDEDDKPYAIHCRRRLQSEASEEIILDENLLAEGSAYFALELLSISPDHRRCLFAIDMAGDERPSLFVKDLTGD